VGCIQVAFAYDWLNIPEIFIYSQNWYALHACDNSELGLFLKYFFWRTSKSMITWENGLSRNTLSQMSIFTLPLSGENNIPSALQQRIVHYNQTASDRWNNGPFPRDQ
jgi:hypothetical protein